MPETKNSLPAAAPKGFTNGLTPETLSERADTGVTDAETSTHLYEPFPIPEIYVDGLSGVHISGPNLRATAFSMQPDGRSINPVAVVRLVMSDTTAQVFMAQLEEAFKAKSEGRRIFARKKVG